MTIVALLIATAATGAVPAGVAAFVRDRGLIRYRVALSDLDGDGRHEALVYAEATTDGAGRADLCGSAGCNLYILSLTPIGYRQVSNTTITRLPIRILPSTSHGWHDLGVQVAEGGVSGHEARLRFDGHGYPPNPSLPLAIRLRNGTGNIVIGADPAAW